MSRAGTPPQPDENHQGLTEKERETFESLIEKAEGTPVADVCRAMLQFSENREANS